jgi:hypothetical protein
MNRQTLHNQLQHRLEDLMEKHQELMQRTPSIPHHEMTEFLQEIRVAYELALSIHQQNAIQSMDDLDMAVAAHYSGQGPVPEVAATPAVQHHPANSEELMVDAIHRVEEQKLPIGKLPKKMAGELNEQFEETATVAQQFRESATLAEMIAQRTGSSRVADSLQHAPIRDLKSAIGINERFYFIQHLFNGDAATFYATVEKLNSSNSLEAAMEYLDTEIVGVYSWNTANENVRHFVELIERRFIA